MATIEEAIYSRLTSYTDLTALVGSRIYPDELPQGVTLPAVVYFKVSDLKNTSLSGLESWESPTIQYSACASTKAGARAVADKIKSALSNYSGTLSGIDVQWISLDNETSTLERTPDGILKVYVESLEFEINYRR